jgi:serine/threonine-protein kinase
MSESSITIGPYAIESELGAGGMGTVYRAVHVETSETVAVKVLSAPMAREPGLVERFRREIESLQKLTNPHIVRFLDSGEHEGTYYYAMELVEGETLTARLRRVTRLGWESVIEMSVQVCRALKAAHDAGIIHRDLKPGNLMLTADDVVKLTDFGVAQIFAAGKLTATGGIVGTAEYMSPEQAEGRKAHPSSDLYSLGAVMYCMLTGRPPFVGRSAVEIIQKQRYGQFDPPRSIVPEMPRWLDDVVCRLMSKDPGARFPNAYVLGLRLQEIPRKVALSQGEDQAQTEVQQSESKPDVDEATSVYRIAEGETGSEPTEAGDELTMPFTAVTADARPRGGGEAGANPAEGGPGEATLARDMMKFEIERQSQRSRFGSWWNSTPGLLVGLLVLVSTGLLLWRMGGMSAEDRFAEGVRLLELSEPDWQTARDRYFTPLVTEDPARWRERVSPHLERIERMAVESGSRPTRRLKAGDATEVARFLRLAREYERLGDRSRATRILESVLGLVDGQAKWESEVGVARALLDEWRGDSVTTDGEGTLLSEALSRAKRARAGGRIEEARRVWQSIVELYAGDTSAEAGVDEARRGLVETEERR